MSYQIDITLRSEFILTPNRDQILSKEKEPSKKEIDKHFLNNDNYKKYILYLVEFTLPFNSDSKAFTQKLNSFQRGTDEYYEALENREFDERVIDSMKYLGNGKMSFTIYTDDEEVCKLIDDFDKIGDKKYRLQMYIIDEIMEDSLADGPWEGLPGETPFIYESKKVPGYELGVFDHRNDYLEVEVNKF